MIIEGEEEVGSRNLDDFIDSHKDLLAADVVVISDTAMFDRGVPSICYGLRGLAYAQIDVRGSKTDLHSGQFGGPLMNPAMALAQILAQMKDKRGRIKIPGFYDDVRELSEAERADYARLPFNEKSFRKEVGAPRLTGEKGYSTLELLSARPTLEINGLLSGFTGTGAKTVLPAVAMAKVSMRLVPDQDPEKIAEAFAEVRAQGGAKERRGESDPDARRRSLEGLTRQRVRAGRRPRHPNRIRCDPRLHP